MAARSSRTFASLLRRHRDDANLTQEELAERAGLGVRTISDLERAISRAPYRGTIRRLAEALELSAEARAELAASVHQRAAHLAPTDATLIEGGFLGTRPTARLVGRREELGRLLAAMDAIEQGAGRLVILAGEPGIGKTRLAQETSMHAWKRHFFVAAGRCYEAQSGLAFYPFLDALSTLYEQSPPANREAIPERWPYLARLLPDYFPLPGAFPLDSREESHRLLRAVTGFVREISADRPVALLIDDLQWADSASVDLLAHLARHTRGDGILLVGTYRDVDVSRGHPLQRALRELEREQLVERLGVRTLGRAATAELMNDRLDGAQVSEEFARLVYDHTDGNPFFTVEVLKDLVERGDLLPRQGRWVHNEIGHLPTPELVSEAISERVSRLHPSTQEALEAASVLGQVFGFEDLLAVADIDPQVAEDALEEAERTGLIRGLRRGYTFNHALSQQAVYGRLSSQRRRRLHRSAGEGLERLEGRGRQQRASEISRQFLAAGSPERALPYVSLAGDEAEALFAHGEAERHYRTALELAAQLGDQAASLQIVEKLGGALAAAARYDEALGALERAADAYRERDDAEATGRVEARIAQTHFRRGTPEEGIARLAAHLELVDKPGASDGVRHNLASLYCALARLCYAHGEYLKCRDAAERGARLSREVDALDLLAEAEMMRGTGLLWSDAREEGVLALEEAVRLAERASTLDTLCTALLPLHLARTVCGEFDRSRLCAERGAAIARKMGDTHLLAMHTANLGLQQFYVGDWDEARGRLEGAVELARTTQPAYFSSLPPAYLGVLRKAEGAWDEATRCFCDAASLAREAGNPEVLGYSESRLAELDVLQGRPDEALARLEARSHVSVLTWWSDVLLRSVLAQAHADMDDALRAEEAADLALTRARLMQNRVDGVEALRVRAKSISMQGRHEEAIATLKEALSWACSMPYPYAEGRILHEYGVLHLADQKPAQAKERVVAALDIFSRLGAKKDAERSRRLLQQAG